MSRKSLADVEWKDLSKGTFRARIATFGVVDFDGDVTLPGAFPEGKAVPISAYGHGSWMGALPVGKGVIAASDEAAYLDGQFFLDTTGGRDTYNTVKGLEGLQEWSYGYEATAESFNKAELAQYPGATRILKAVEPYEASPVLRGAGIGTTTESIKDGGLVAVGERLAVLGLIVPEIEAFMGRASVRKGGRLKVGRTLSSATRGHLQGLLDAVRALSELEPGLRDLLSETDASAIDDGKAAALPADILSIFAAVEAKRTEEWRQFEQELGAYVRAGAEA